MLSSFTSQALATKVKARFGKRLTESQYQELLHKRSVAELAGWLKNQPAYSNVLKDVQESAIHREQLENILRRNIFAQYMELLNFNFDGKDSYYVQRVRKLEVDQILQMVQALNSGDVQGYVSQVPSFASHYARFDFMSLSGAEDFDGLINALRGTPYAALMMPLRPLPGKLIDYPSCEKTLYSNYYKELYFLLGHSFNKKVSDELTKSISIRAQLLNLESIYRLKRYFSMSPEEIKPYLLPGYAVNPQKKLGDKRLFDRLLNAATPEEFLQIFAASHFGKYTQGDEAGLEGHLIEQVSQRISYRFSIQKLCFSTSAPVILTAYIALLEIEVQNLVTIIEGIRYGLAAEEIEKMLIVK